MKIKTLIIEQDRIAMMKAMQEKKYQSISDDLPYETVQKLRGMLNRKAGKKSTLKGISNDTLSSLRSYKLVNDVGQPTPLANQFMQWLDNKNSDNRSAEMKTRQFRQKADKALKFSDFNKRSNPNYKYSDQSAVKARKVLQRLDNTDRVILNKLYNKFYNRKFKNLSTNWGSGKAEDVSKMKSIGVLDSSGELTKLGNLLVSALKFYDNDEVYNKDDPSAGKVPKQHNTRYQNN